MFLTLKTPGVAVDPNTRVQYPQVSYNNYATVGIVASVATGVQG